jgi:hypothetical protein
LEYGRQVDVGVVICECRMGRLAIEKRGSSRK